MIRLLGQDLFEFRTVHLRLEHKNFRENLERWAQRSQANANLVGNITHRMRNLDRWESTSGAVRAVSESVLFAGLGFENEAEYNREVLRFLRGRQDLAGLETMRTTIASFCAALGLSGIEITRGPLKLSARALVAIRLDERKKVFPPSLIEMTEPMVLPMVKNAEVLDDQLALLDGMFESTLVKEYQNELAADKSTPEEAASRLQKKKRSTKTK